MVMTIDTILARGAPMDRGRTMKWKTLCSLALLLFAIAPAIPGCSPVKQARDVKASGFLGDYSMLRRGGQGEAILVYHNPRAHWETYNRVVLAPVLVWAPGEIGKKGAPEEELDRIARNFYELLSEEVSRDYEMVEERGPGTLRIQAVITDVQRTWETGAQVSSEDPVQRGLGTLEEYSTGKPLYSVEVRAEFKITDAQSGRLLHASVDRRFGGNVVEGSRGRWQDVNTVLRFWAEQIRFTLCRLRGGADCIQPKG
jgi:hypothetical protein